MSDEKTVDEIMAEDEEIIDEGEGEETEGKDDDPGKGKESESIESLKAQVEALTKEKHGMYREMRSGRDELKEMKGKLDAITETMAAARARREEMVSGAAADAVDGSVTTKAGIPVSFTADGDPYIDPKDIPKGMMNTGEMASLKRELAELKNQAFHQTAVSQNQRILTDVIAGDERFAGAYAEVQKAYQYLDAKTAEVMKSYGLTLQTTTIEEMMDLLEKEVGDEFSEKFPGFDMDVIVEACTTGPNGLIRPRKVQKALSAAVASGAGGKTNKNIENLRLITSKPSSLAGQRNQKGAVGRTLDDIANMSVKDFETMSDAEFKKLERALARMG